jgi:hypothetical protein
MSPALRKLKSTVCYALSTEALAALHIVAESPDPDAIRVLSFALAVEGVVGKAAVEALVRRGNSVEPAMRRCLESVNEATVRGAHRVLAKLGDARSQVAQHSVCWADIDDDIERAELLRARIARTRSTTPTTSDTPRP